MDLKSNPNKVGGLVHNSTDQNLEEEIADWAKVPRQVKQIPRLKSRNFSVKTAMKMMFITWHSK